ncbi:hypothetical protein Y032_0153g2945 [Ancylostoma ceylanicum]|uniref:Uncharacterized protein n=1 Tax=Ancylostoma ceylanicum TaxID=53326 RepID=A0A016T0B7_9BILA|nr:hypothetical protein Y032_0153g2945 [Ancylostoma ceylanicum]
MRLTGRTTSSSVSLPFFIDLRLLKSRLTASALSNPLQRPVGLAQREVTLVFEVFEHRAVFVSGGNFPLEWRARAVIIFRHASPHSQSFRDAQPGLSFLFASLKTTVFCRVSPHHSVHQ